MAKTKTLERTYNIPLRKEFRKVANWKQTKKAVKAVKEFLAKHMKSDDVRLGKHLNEKLWQHGIKNPPHHVKVTTIKDEKGVVKAELFGHKIEEKKEKPKKSKLEEVAQKVGLKPKKVEDKTTETKKPVQKKTEEKKDEVKKEEKSEQPKKRETKKEKPEAPQEKSSESDNKPSPEKTN